MIGAALLALSAAGSFAIAGVFLRRALVYTTPSIAALISVTFTAAFIWLITAATAPLALLLSPAILPFIGAGLMAPGLARLVLYTGVSRVGVARASALVSTTPFFAVLLAILLLGERPAPPLLAGAAAVVAGGVLLSFRARDERHFRRRDLALPIVAALGFALRDILSRFGLRDYPHPMIAAAAATASSVTVMWLIAAISRTRVLATSRQGLGFMALAGIFETAAYLTMWRALAMGEVSVISPLINAQPLFTVVLAMLFLRDLERMTWRIAVASALIVLGIGLVLRVA